MTIFPAIDILNGRCVRLLYGDKNKVTDYGTPLEAARRWFGEGATNLHMVDLNGAFEGESKNLSAINEVCSLASRYNASVQLGGGIRCVRHIQLALEAGVHRVILGTSLLEQNGFLQEAVEGFAGKIVAGIDAKNGFVAVKGWVESSQVTPIELGKRVKSAGIDTVLYTDITRDGALTGVNLEACLSMQQQSGLRVIASGGVSSVSDVERLRNAGVYGCILGRAIYEGAINLADII